MQLILILLIVFLIPLEGISTLAKLYNLLIATVLVLGIASTFEFRALQVEWLADSANAALRDRGTASHRSRSRSMSREGSEGTASDCTRNDTFGALRLQDKLAKMSSP